MKYKIGDQVIITANPLVVNLEVTVGVSLLNEPICAKIIDNKHGLEGVIVGLEWRNKFIVKTEFGEIPVSSEDLIFSTKLQRAMYEN